MAETLRTAKPRTANPALAGSVRNPREVRSPLLVRGGGGEVAVSNSEVQLDFANTAEDIVEAFEPYYEATKLADVTDPNIVHERLAT